MEDHAKMSWKEDTILGQLHNSVDHAEMAVGQALTNPSEQFIHQAQLMIERAERSVENAIKNQGETDPVISLQEQLNDQKARLGQLH